MAAHAHSDADVLQICEFVRGDLFSVGSAIEAIPNTFRDWRFLRAVLTEQQKNARRIAALSRWRAANFDNTRIADWMDKPLRKDGEAIRILQHLRNNLAGEITTRGDKCIPDPVAIADAFFSEIAPDRHTVAAGSDLPPAIQLLVDAGLDPGNAGT